MLKLWQNTKWSTKIALIFCIILVALVAGWFSDWIPSTILDSYRAEYDAMKKDPDTGFPSLEDRKKSNGMGMFMAMAYWYGMAQNRTKMRDTYTEALYRYGWDHPRGPELWVDLMESNFSGSNADRNEGDAICYYWLFCEKYNEKYGERGSFTPHPQFKEYEPAVAKMIARRGSLVPSPSAESDYDVRGSVHQLFKNRGARNFLTDFFRLNRRLKINQVDLEAAGDEDPETYFPADAEFRNFSVAEWKR